MRLEGEGSPLLPVEPPLYAKLKSRHTCVVNRSEFGPTLRRVPPEKVILSSGDALAVLHFFFPLEVKLQKSQISIEDRGFAQAILTEAVVATGLEAPPPPAEGEVPHVVGRLATGYIDLYGPFLRFLRRSRSEWFAPLTPEQLTRVSISECARSDVAIRHRSIWMARLQSGFLLWPPQV